MEGGVWWSISVSRQEAGGGRRSEGTQPCNPFAFPDSGLVQSLSSFPRKISYFPFLFFFYFLTLSVSLSLSLQTLSKTSHSSEASPPTFLSLALSLSLSLSHSLSMALTKTPAFLVFLKRKLWGKYIMPLSF